MSRAIAFADVDGRPLMIARIPDDDLTPDGAQPITDEECDAAIARCDGFRLSGGRLYALTPDELQADARCARFADALIADLSQLAVFGILEVAAVGIL